MTRQEFERQDSALSRRRHRRKRHHSLSRHRSLSCHNGNLRHACRRRVIVSVAVHGKPCPLGLSARIPAIGSAARITNSDRDAAAIVARKDSRRRRRHVRAPAGLLRRVPPVSRRTEGRSDNPLAHALAPRRSLARQPRIAAQWVESSRIRSEQHQAPYRHSGHRQLRERAQTTMFPPRRAAHPALARKLRPSALRTAWILSSWAIAGKSSARQFLSAGRR